MTELIAIELEKLPTMGFIKIKFVGEENMYFEDTDGKKYFCKINR